MRKAAMFLIFLSAVAVVAFLWQPVSACTIVDPHPILPITHIHPQPPIPPTPVKAIETKEHRADITISGQLACVDVDAVFHNPNSSQVEGTYFFPLPADVVVNQFSLFINGKEVNAELLDAERALKVYEDIVTREIWGQALKREFS
ncbi:MAG: VIT domain-containing protein [Candidatus Omnitrophota bacterium]